MGNFTEIYGDFSYFHIVDTQCGGENVTQKRVEACEDESAKHSPGTVTSVLPLIKEAATEVFSTVLEVLIKLKRGFTEPKSYQRPVFELG